MKRSHIIKQTLEILRDTADDLERKHDMDSTAARLVIRASVNELEFEIWRLREALRKIVSESLNAESIAQDALDT